MNPNVWGPHFWFFLQTIAMNYPLHPNAITKRKYYELIQNLPLFIPLPEIGNKFARLLDQYPITPYLSSRLSFMKWVHFIHNKINYGLGKPEIEFYEGLESYYEYYKPKEIIQKDITKKKKTIYRSMFNDIYNCIDRLLV